MFEATALPHLRGAVHVFDRKVLVQESQQAGTPIGEFEWSGFLSRVFGNIHARLILRLGCRTRTEKSQFIRPFVLGEGLVTSTRSRMVVHGNRT